MASVIAIRGVQGSGKTWICQELARRAAAVHRPPPECYDTDDLVHTAWTTLRRNPDFNRKLAMLQQPPDVPAERPREPAWHRDLMRSVRRQVATIVERAKARGTAVIFVGITGSGVEPDESYFITMKREELENAYRRVLRRELAKIADNITAIARDIDTAPLQGLSAILNHQYNLALSLDTSFGKYLSEYKHALGFEKRRGLKLMSQSRIVERIARRLDLN